MRSPDFKAIDYQKETDIALFTIDGLTASRHLRVAARNLCYNGFQAWVFVDTVAVQITDAADRDYVKDRLGLNRGTVMDDVFEAMMQQRT